MFNPTNTDKKYGFISPALDKSYNERQERSETRKAKTSTFMENNKENAADTQKRHTYATPLGKRKRKPMKLNYINYEGNASQCRFNDSDLSETDTSDSESDDEWDLQHSHLRTYREEHKKPT